VNCHPLNRLLGRLGIGSHNPKSTATGIRFRVLVRRPFARITAGKPRAGEVSVTRQLYRAQTPGTLWWIGVGKCHLQMACVYPRIVIPAPGTAQVKADDEITSEFLPGRVESRADGTVRFLSRPFASASKNAASCVTLGVVVVHPSICCMERGSLRFPRHKAPFRKTCRVTPSLTSGISASQGGRLALATYSPSYSKSN
jgi:hypothetical protein